jgi:hypothetical protein
MIEASPSTYPSGMLPLGKVTHERGEDLRRFSTQPHQFYCGIDLQARTMSLCSLHQDGEIMLHRTMKARPEMWLKAIAPYRDDSVVAVDGIFHLGLARGPGRA